MRFFFLVVLLGVYPSEGGDWSIWTSGQYGGREWSWLADNVSFSSSYEIWSSGSPPSSPTTGHVVLMLDVDEFKFTDVDPTSTSRRYMCESDVGEVDCPAGYGRIIYGSTHCWKLKGRSPAPTWQWARDDCIAEGGDLLAISSLQEYNAIRNWLLPNVPTPPPTTTVEQTTELPTTPVETTEPTPEVTSTAGEISSTVELSSAVYTSTLTEDVPTTVTDIPTTEPDIPDVSSTVKHTTTAMVDEAPLTSTILSNSPTSEVISTSTSPSSHLSSSTPPIQTSSELPMYEATTIASIKQPTINLRFTNTPSTAKPRNVDVTTAPLPQPPPLIDFLRTAPPLVDSQVENMDLRPSAIVIGVTAIIFLIAFVVLVCVLDSTSWYRDCRKLKRNIKRAVKRKNNETDVDKTL